MKLIFILVYLSTIVAINARSIEIWHNKERGDEFESVVLATEEVKGEPPDEDLSSDVKISDEQRATDFQFKDYGLNEHR